MNNPREDEVADNGTVDYTPDSQEDDEHYCWDCDLGQPY